MTAETRRDGGFMMVALLIAMAIVAIWMTAALPKWGHQAQRAKEEELIFRGEQYARAIVLYQNKNRGVPPADFDILVSQHFLRKKWKDPVTGCDFVPVGIGVNSNPTNCPKYAQMINQQTPTSAAPLSAQAQPGITGVRSQSRNTSIKIYMQQQTHSAWPFDAAVMRGRMGGAAGANPQQQQPGRGGADGRGGRGGDAVGPPRGGAAAPGRGGAPGGAPVGAPAAPPRGGRGGGGN